MKMRKEILLITFLFLFITGTAMGATPKVEHLQTQVLNEELPVEVRDRIATSFSTVGEHMLVGKAVDDIMQNRSSYQNLMRSVFERVLSGFFIEELVIEPGETTQIKVKLTAWGEVVQQVEVFYQEEAIPDLIQPWINEDLKGIAEKIPTFLEGTPVEAVEWTSSLIKERVRSEIKERLPEYLSIVEIESGLNSKVTITLIPQGQLFGAPEVAVSSETYPITLLLPIKRQLQTDLNSLQGVPIAFLDRHENNLKTLIRTQLKKNGQVSRYKLVETITWQSRKEPQLLVDINSHQWRIALEAWLDMGNDDKSKLVGFAHLGYRIKQNQELFAEGLASPTDIDYWDFRIGYSRQLGSNTWLGVRHSFSESKPSALLEHHIGKQWTIRLESTFDGDWYEAGIRYRFHEFLSGEIVGDKDTFYLRLRGNF